MSLKHGKDFLRLVGWNSPTKIGEICLKAGATLVAVKTAKRTIDSVDQAGQTADHLINTTGDTLRHNISVISEKAKMEKK